MIKNIANLRSNTVTAKSDPAMSTKTGGCTGKRKKPNTLKRLVLGNIGRSAFMLSSILAFSSLSVYGAAEHLSKAAEKQNAVGMVTSIRNKESSSMWDEDEQPAPAEREDDEPDSDVIVPTMAVYIGGMALVYIFYSAAKNRCYRKDNEKRRTATRLDYALKRFDRTA